MLAFGEKRVLSILIYFHSIFGCIFPVRGIIPSQIGQIIQRNLLLVKWETAAWQHQVCLNFISGVRANLWNGHRRDFYLPIVTKVVPQLDRNLKHHRFTQVYWARICTKTIFSLNLITWDQILKDNSVYNFTPMGYLFVNFYQKHLSGSVFFVHVDGKAVAQYVGAL